MPYAYRDKYGILHAIEDATEEAQGGVTVVEYDGKCDGGYPFVGRYRIIDEGPDGIKVDTGNSKDRKPLAAWPGSVVADVKAFLAGLGI